jgi:predicted small integral membrane protein
MRDVIALRVSKAVLVFAIALFCTILILNSITDYGSNSGVDIIKAKFRMVQRKRPAAGVPMLRLAARNCFVQELA